MTLFHEFLQVAIGNRKSLSVGISEADWQRLFAFCQRQALLGIGFTAVERLHAIGVVCPASLRRKWMNVALMMEGRNKQMNEQCKELTSRLRHDGLDCCVLKGQGNLLNYPEEIRMRRCPGDIDVWCIPPQEGLDIAVQTGKDEVEYVKYKDCRAIIEYAKLQYRICGSGKYPRAIYHHIDAPSIGDTEVEYHYKPSFCRSMMRNWRMQRWFANHAAECTKHTCLYGFPIPTPSINVIYQMCHLYNHYFDEGIGLRQLMDYYFVLRMWRNDLAEMQDWVARGVIINGIATPVMSVSEVMAVLRSFGIAKFAGAVMWVLNEVFVGANENDNEKENLSNHRMKRRNAEGCPQADEEGEHEWNTTKTITKTGTTREAAVCPQADVFGGTAMSAMEQQLKENYVAPWMICEPNEKEGKKLLAEIMQGGNFGQYDTRDATLKKGGMMKHGLWKLKRVMRLVSSYPEEALWEPVFRMWHLVWRGING